MRTTLLGVASIAASLLAGCSSSDTPTDVESLQAQVEVRQAEAEAAAQAQERQVDCLEAAGVKVEAHPDGSMTVHDLAGDDGGERAMELSDACEESANFPEYQPVTDVEYSYMYDLNIEAKSCLEGLGYEISDPPSRESWIALAQSEQAGNETLWSPYLEIPPNELDLVERDCPQRTILDFDGS
ncbi:hypothetical protein FNH13_12755 [Ornithinimicrobium ciconiae]|uniref:Secreted protein n=1 Tax=Ornithinimicrobium ciconiae TaxID=2594265 RepID=A0A516GC25_9MICO|nr:hypothetical protein [Ornithinimicrobium ciconiae]QDO89086.1 hypothetical protein FNH13_12755 [Ornithinimicrobium ciconiae]